MKARPPCARRSRFYDYGAAMACAAIGCWIAFREPAPDTATEELSDLRRERPDKYEAETQATALGDYTPDRGFIEATARADRERNPDERDAARMSALLAWSERDARGAFLHLFNRRPSPSITYQRDLLFQRWAAVDFDGADDFTDRLPAGDSRETLLGLLAMEALRIDPAQAAAIIMGDMTPGPIQTEAVVSAVHQWALKDHVAASEWVGGFPAGALRERAEREIAGLTRVADGEVGRR